MNYITMQSWLNRQIYIRNPNRKTYKKARWKRKQNRVQKRMLNYYTDAAIMRI